jgi:hypothetical protein
LNYLIVSYYTPAYRREASGLMESLDALGFRSDEYVITAVQDRGSWERNCSYKPTFVRHMMVAHDCPIVWLDADARVRRHPVLFDALPPDAAMACHYRHGEELLSGTTWWNNNAAGWELLGLWEKECQAHPTVWDQKSLAAVVEANKRFKVAGLPSEYVRVFDDAKMGEAVIEHGQASRRLKK